MQGDEIELSAGKAILPRIMPKAWVLPDLSGRRVDKRIFLTAGIGIILILLPEYC